MRNRLIAMMVLACGTISARADADKPTFVDDVLPLLRQSCLSCHNDDRQRGGLNLSSFASAMEGGSSGAVVKPGAPDQSRLFTLSAHTEEPKMPPNADRMPQPKLDLLRRWIEQGARENAGSKLMAVKPAAAATAAVVTRGRPEGPPPMPGKLLREPVLVGRRPAAVLALAANPWSPVAALGGLQQVMLYHLETGELLGILPFPAGQVNVLAFSRNGKQLLAVGGRGGQAGAAVLFDLATGKPLWTIDDPNDAILAADLSPDETLVALGGPGKTVRIVATADGTPVHQIKKHTDWVTALEFSPDGVLLASGDRNGGLHVWEAATGREFHTLKGPPRAVTALSWRDDSNTLAVSSEDGSIRMFEPENGTQIKNWNAHPGGAAWVRFDHEGRLVSTGRDRVTKLWDGNGGQIKAYEAFPDLGLRAAISHDGKQVIAGDWSGEVRVWSANEATLQARLDSNPPTAAERFRRALRQVAAAGAREAETAAALNTAKQAAENAEVELAAFRKTIDESEAAAKSADTALGTAKAAHDKAAAEAAAARAVEKGRGVPLRALEQALKHVRDAADKEPDNAELKAQAGKVAEYVRAAKIDWEAARKDAATAAAAEKAASEQLKAAQDATAAAAAGLTAAREKLAAEEAARKPVREAVAAAEKQLDAARGTRRDAETTLLREYSVLAPLLSRPLVP